MASTLLLFLRDIKKLSNHQKNDTSKKYLYQWCNQCHGCTFLYTYHMYLLHTTLYCENRILVWFIMYVHVTLQSRRCCCCFACETPEINQIQYLYRKIISSTGNDDVVLVPVCHVYYVVHVVACTL